jgi:hypothetical protein
MLNNEKSGFLNLHLPKIKNVIPQAIEHCTTHVNEIHNKYIKGEQQSSNYKKDNKSVSNL